MDFSLIAINLSKIRSYCDEWDNSVYWNQNSSLFVQFLSGSWVVD